MSETVTTRAQPNRDRWRCLFYALLLGGLFILGGFNMLVRNLAGDAQGKRSLDYLRTSGTVTDASLGTGHRGSHTMVRYKYKVDGNTYSSDRVSFSGGAHDTDYYRHPVGSSVDVFYDAQNPAQACLEKGVRSFDDSFTQGAAWTIIATGFLLIPMTYLFARKNGVDRLPSAKVVR